MKQKNFENNRSMLNVKMICQIVNSRRCAFEFWINMFFIKDSFDQNVKCFLIKTQSVVDIRFDVWQFFCKLIFRLRFLLWFSCFFSFSNRFDRKCCIDIKFDVKMRIENESKKTIRCRVRQDVVNIENHFSIDHDVMFHEVEHLWTIFFDFNNAFQIKCCKDYDKFSFSISTWSYIFVKSYDYMNKFRQYFESFLKTINLKIEKI